MPGQPVISVVIPTYNRALPLKRCLESLGQQTLPSELYEVIVVDDASEDETLHVVQRLDLPATFCYVRQEHGGSAVARNRGAALARGELLLFFDDDVVATPPLLEAHLRAHRQWGRCAVLGYTPFADNLARTPIMEHHRARWERIFADVDKAQSAGEVPFNYFITLNLSLRRADFETIGPFETVFNAAFEDTELGLRFAREGVPLRFCREAFAWHCPHLDERSLTKRQEQFGYRAGLYYLRRPDDQIMAEAMNVSYVLGKSACGKAAPSLRSRLRRLILSNWLVDVLLLLVVHAGGALPKGLREYLYRLIAWHHYGQGFRRALAQAGKCSRTRDALVG